MKKYKALICFLLAAYIVVLSSCGIYDRDKTGGAPRKEEAETAADGDGESSPSDGGEEDSDGGEQNVPADDDAPQGADVPDAESDRLDADVGPGSGADDIFPVPDDADLVRITDYIPSVVIDLKYATEDNFTGELIYDFDEPLLRYGTVKKLMKVQALLLEWGYSLKIWDGYRPVEAQFKLWETCPDPKYVSDPNGKGSGHSRGNTVDVTLVDINGNEVEMPTGFDNFTALADRDYGDVSAEAAENAVFLEETMESCGFRGYSGEWWHFTDETDYPMIETETE